MRPVPKDLANLVWSTVKTATGNNRAADDALVALIHAWNAALDEVEGCVCNGAGKCLYHEGLK